MLLTKHTKEIWAGTEGRAHRIIGSAYTTDAADDSEPNCRAELRHLPQYSPDLNPIESVLHPQKTLLRKSAERTVNGLQRRVGSFIRGLKPSEGVGYFRHAGYDPL